MVALLSVKGAVQQGGSHPKGQSEGSAVDMDAGLIFAILLLHNPFTPFFFILSLFFSFLSLAL